MHSSCDRAPMAGREPRTPICCLTHDRANYRRRSRRRQGRETRRLGDAAIAARSAAR